MRVADTLSAYAISLQERFIDPSEKHRNAEKMRSLKYDGDIEQYLTEIMDLNDVVEWSGITLQTHIYRLLPDEITRLVYSRHGGIPSTDDWKGEFKRRLPASLQVALASAYHSDTVDFEGYARLGADIAFSYQQANAKRDREKAKVDKNNTIADRMDLHLLWTIKRKLFVKPIARFLLDPA